MLQFVFSQDWLIWIAGLPSVCFKLVVFKGAAFLCPLQLSLLLQDRTRGNPKCARKRFPCRGKCLHDTLRTNRMLALVLWRLPVSTKLESFMLLPKLFVPLATLKDHFLPWADTEVARCRGLLRCYSAHSRKARRTSVVQTKTWWVFSSCSVRLA